MAEGLAGSGISNNPIGSRLLTLPQYLSTTHSSGASGAAPSINSRDARGGVAGGQEPPIPHST